MKELIVFLSPIHWNHVFQRPQHLALGFSRNRTVVFVSNSTNNTGWLGKGRVVTINSSLYDVYPPKIGPNSSAGQVLATSQHNNKNCKSHKLADGIIAFSRFVYSINYILDGLYLRFLIANFKPQRIILWVSSPAYLFSIPFIGKTDLLIYDRLDDFANMPGFGKETKFWDLILAKKADVVFSSSKKLNDFAKLHSRKPIILRNAVEYAHFDVSNKEVTCPPDLFSIPEPRICFVGVIGDWIDLELVAKVAISHPQWHFVFIGPYKSKKNSYTTVPNIHFLGKKSYSTIPSYLAHIAICLLPFKITTLTNSVNPVKLYEYLAAGKPIISTRIAESILLKDFLTLVDSPDELSDAILKLLNSKNERQTKKGQIFARSNDWNSRVQLVEEIFSSKDPGK